MSFIEYKRTASTDLGRLGTILRRSPRPLKWLSADQTGGAEGASQDLWRRPPYDLHGSAGESDKAGLQVWGCSKLPRHEPVRGFPAFTC